MTEMNVTSNDIRLALPAAVERVLSVLEDAAIPAYVVGGAVRDSIMGREVHDWDVAAAAPPETSAELFTARGFRVIPTGIRHGTITVLSDGEPIEITAFRVDGSYSDGRHPDSVSFTSNIEEDLARRDLTVNAMAYSPSRGLCDPFDGRGDIARRRIRCVGDPRRRFTEDALRIMRSFRFAAVLDYEIDPATLSAAAELAGKLCAVSAERIAAEGERLLSAAHPAKQLCMAAKAGLPAVVLCGISPPHAELEAVDRLPADPALRLGAILRHVGLKDPEPVRAATAYLRLSNKGAARALAAATVKLPPPDITSVRRFMREVGNADAAILAAAARGEDDSGEILRLFDQIIREGGPVTMRTLAVGGRDLHAAGVPYGREMGQVLDFLLEAATADPTLNSREVLLTMAAARYREIIAPPPSGCSEIKNND